MSTNGHDTGAGAGLFRRETTNPVLTPDDWPYPVGAVFNPGAALVDGRTVLLCRVEDRRGISHLTVARSDDGRTGWRIDPQPLICADPQDSTTCWGVENPRLTWVEQSDTWLIAYTAYGPGGPCVALACSPDFYKVEHLGVVRPPEDKDACVLSRLIDGQFVLFHRPSSPLVRRADIWMSRSVDLRAWSTPEPVMRARAGVWWDGTRIGMGPPPLDTPQGWLVVYHGVKDKESGPVYCTGLALLDHDDPAKVLHRGEEWVLSPTAPYERSGDVPNALFPTGLVHDPFTDELRLYYGAGDSVVAMASAPLSVVMDHVLSCPPDAA